jgi:RHS repeat-associated protein
MQPMFLSLCLACLFLANLAAAAPVVFWPSALFLLGLRYYDPARGLFLTNDPVPVWKSVGHGHTWNQRWYAGGIPTSATDPRGEQPQTRGEWQYQQDYFRLLKCFEKYHNGEGAVEYEHFAF